MMERKAAVFPVILIIGWLGLAGLYAPATGQTGGTDPARSASVPESDPPAASPTGPQMTDIHDIKPPERPAPRPAWIYFALMAGAVLCLAALVILMRRRSRRNPSGPSRPLLSPARRALQALEDLREVARFDGRTFYFRLSAIVREYLRGRFGMDAPEMTTEELLPRIRELNLPADLQGDLRALLRNAEPIKFGGAAAVQRQMETDLAFAVAFIHDTDPAGDADGEKTGREAAA